MGYNYLSEAGIARQNVFTVFLEYYQYIIGQLPEIKVENEAATIVSWNLW